MQRRLVLLIVVGILLLDSVTSTQDIRSLVTNSRRFKTPTFFNDLDNQSLLVEESQSTQADMSMSDLFKSLKKQQLPASENESTLGLEGVRDNRQEIRDKLQLLMKNEVKHEMEDEELFQDINEYSKVTTTASDSNAMGKDSLANKPISEEEKEDQELQEFVLVKEKRAEAQRELDQRMSIVNRLKQLEMDRELALKNAEKATEESANLEKSREKQRIEAESAKRAEEERLNAMHQESYRRVVEEAEQAREANRLAEQARLDEANRIAAEKQRVIDEGLKKIEQEKEAERIAKALEEERLENIRKAQEKAKAEQERLLAAEADAENKKREEEELEEARIRAVNEAKAKEEELAKAKAQAEQEAYRKMEAEQEEFEAKAKAEAEAKQRAIKEAEEKARAQAESEAKAKEQAEAQAREEANFIASAKAQAEEKLKAEADEEAEEEAEAEAQAQAQAQAQAEAESQAKQEAAEQKMKEEKAAAEKEAEAIAAQKAKEQAEADAILKQEQEMKEATEAAQQKANQQAQAELQAQAIAEANARAQAEIEADRIRSEQSATPSVADAVQTPSSQELEQQAKNSQSSSDDESAITFNPNIITLQDEGGKNYSFQRSNKLIPLVSPRGVFESSFGEKSIEAIRSDEVDSDKNSALGNQLKQRIFRESTSHLDSNDVIKQKESADSFKFILAKSRQANGSDSDKKSTEETTATAASTKDLEGQSAVKTDDTQSTKATGVDAKESESSSEKSAVKSDEGKTEVPTSDKKEAGIKEADEIKKLTYEVTDNSTLTSNVAILCSEANMQQYKAVQRACGMCSTDEVFLLTEDNWFKVGLANNHKKEFQTLLNQASDVFGNTHFVVGFSKSTNEICLAAEHIAAPVVLATVLSVYMNSTIGDFAQNKTQIVTFPEQVKLFHVSFKTSFAKQEKSEVLIPSYSKFTMVVGETLVRKIDAVTTLKFENIVFMQNELTVVYFGSLSLNSYKAQIHFQINENTRAQNYLNLIIDIPNESTTFQRQAFKMFAAKDLQEIVSQMQLPRGLQQVENVKISSFMLSLPFASSSYELIMNYDEVAGFALNSQLNLQGCSGWTVITKDMNSTSFVHESSNFICSVRELPSYSRIYIKKTNATTSYQVRLAEDAYPYATIEEKIFYPISQSKSVAADLATQLSGLLNLETARLSAIEVHVDFASSGVIYNVKAKLSSSEFKGLGRIQIKFSRIHGFVSAYAQIEFDAMNLNDSILVKSKDLQHTKPKSLLFFIAGSESNSVNFPQLASSEFGPKNQTTWDEGVFVEYAFDLQADCPIGSVLDGLKLPLVNYTFEGYYRNGSVLLSHNLQNNLAFGGPLKVNGTSLNLRLSSSSDVKATMAEWKARSTRAQQLAAVSVGEFYLEGNLDLKVRSSGLNSSDTLPFSAVITKASILSPESSGGVVLIAQADESWSHALGNENLSLSEIVLSAKIEDARVDAFTLNALGVFGSECLVEVAESGDIGAKFDQSRCFYGNSRLKIDFVDPSKTVFSSHIPSITPRHIFGVLLGFSEMELASDIANPIMSMSFPQGLSVVFTQANSTNVNVPAAATPVTTSAAVTTPATTNSTTVIPSKDPRIPKGFTLSGTSELLGIKGQIAMNVNANQYFLGLFRFESLTLAGGNIVIVESTGNAQNNIVLRASKGTNKISLTEQIFFRPEGFFFGIPQRIEMTISRETGYRIETQEAIFGGSDALRLRIQAPYTNDIHTAEFMLNAEFTEAHLQRISGKLLGLTRNWVNRTQALFSDLAERVADVERELVVLTKAQCSTNSCSIREQCTSVPTERCVKYAQKSVCLQKEPVCMQENEVCMNEEVICIEKAVTCKEFSASDPTKCVAFEDSCAQEIKRCTNYQMQCVSDVVSVCTKSSYVNDQDKCLETQMVCDVALVKDSNCELECTLKSSQHATKAEIFDKFSKALLNLSKRNENFSEMVNFVGVAANSDKIIGASGAKLQVKLDALVSSKRYDVTFEINTFAPEFANGSDKLAIELEAYDFSNEDSMVRNLFKKIQLEWAKSFQIDELLLNDDSTAILHDILTQIHDSKEGMSESLAMLLQMGAHWNHPRRHTLIEH